MLTTADFIIDWGRLSANQCVASIEILLESSGEASQISIEEGISTLLAHASICDDLETHVIYARIIKDASALSSKVLVPMILDWIPTILHPIPYINIIPTLLSNDTTNLFVKAVSILENLLLEDAQLTLPILPVLCDLHDSSNDLSDRIQKLLEMTVDVVCEDKLGSLLQVIAKCSRITKISFSVQKLHNAFSSLTLMSLGQIIEPLLSAFSSSSKLVDEFWLVTIYRAKNSSCVVPIDLAISSICFAKGDARFKKLFIFWLRSHPTLLIDLERMLDMRGSAHSLRTLRLHMWCVASFLFDEITGLVSSGIQTRSYSSDLSSLVCSLFSREVSLRDLIVNRFIVALFSTDTDSDNNNTQTLPPLGGACTALLSKAKLRPKMKQEHSVSYVSADILLHLNSCDTAGAAVGSSLLSALSSRLVADSNMSVHLLPLPILKYILRIIISASNRSIELQGAVFIMTQKLIGNRWGVQESLLGTALSSSSIEQAIFPFSVKDESKFSLHLIGVLLANATLNYSSGLSLEDRATLVALLSQNLESGNVDDSTVHILRSLYEYSLQENNLKEADLTCTIKYAVECFFLEHGCLRNATESENLKWITIPQKWPSEQAFPRNYNLKYIAEAAFSLLCGRSINGEVDIEEWVTLISESVDFINLCICIDSQNEKVVHIGVSSELQLDSYNPISFLDINVFEGLSINFQLRLCFEMVLLFSSLSGYLWNKIGFGCPSDEMLNLSIFLNYAAACRLYIKSISSISKRFLKSGRSPLKNVPLDSCDNILLPYLETITAQFSQSLDLSLSQIPRDIIHRSLLFLTSTSVVFTELGLSVLLCYVSSTINHLNCFKQHRVYNSQLERESTDLSGTRLCGYLDFAINAMESLRLSNESGVAGDTSGVISIGKSINISTGQIFLHQDYVAFSVSTYLEYFTRISMVRSQTRSSSEFCERLSDPHFISSFFFSLTSDASSTSWCDIMKFYELIERQVKISQDSTVATGGFRLLAEIAAGTSLSTRCCSLAFLMSTLLFSNHTDIKDSQNCVLELLGKSFTDLLDFSSFSSDFTSKQVLNSSNESSGRLVINLHKYLNSVFYSNSITDSSISIKFFLTWWLKEDNVYQTVGLWLLLHDVLQLYVNQSLDNNQTRLGRSDLIAEDSLVLLGSLPSPNEIFSSNDSEQEKGTSVEASKIRRIILNDDEDEQIEMRRRIRFSIPQIIPIVTSHQTQLFTTLARGNAFTFFEVSFSLLPYTLQSSTPLSDSFYGLDSRCPLALLEGPYIHVILPYLVAIEVITKLLSIIKDGEHPRFVIDISSVAIRVVASLADSIVVSLLKCSEWRNLQRIDIADHIDVRHKGCLKYFAIVCGWGVYLVNLLINFLSSLKVYLIEEGRFDFPKSLPKILFSNQIKCEKSKQNILSIVADHRINLLKLLPAISTFHFGHQFKNVLSAMADQFKKQIVDLVEESLPSRMDRGVANCKVIAARNSALVSALFLSVTKNQKRGNSSFEDWGLFE